MLKQMQVEAVWVADNGVNLYIFHDGNLIGYRRLFFNDDATKTLQIREPNHKLVVPIYLALAYKQDQQWQE